MKTKQLVGSAVLSISLLAGAAFAGEVQPMPSAPPPPGPTAKIIHIPRAAKNTVPLTVFDLLSMVLSNLGILQ